MMMSNGAPLQCSWCVCGRILISFIFRSSVTLSASYISAASVQHAWSYTVLNLNTQEQLSLFTHPEQSIGSHQRRN